MNWLFASGVQSIRLQHKSFQWIFIWFPLELTGWISLKSKRLSRVFSNTRAQKHQSFDTQPSLQTKFHIHKRLLENIALTRQTFVSKTMPLFFNMLSRFVTALLPRSECLLISSLQSPSAVILGPPKMRSVTVSIVSPSLCHEMMRPNAIIFIFEYWVLSQFFHSPLFIKRLFGSSSLPAISGFICISEFVDISPSKLGSSLCFIQLSISHDVLCIKVK